MEKFKDLLELLKYHRFFIENTMYLGKGNDVYQKPLIVSEEEYFNCLMEQKRALNKKN